MKDFFKLQYKSDSHARYYAYKRERTLGRRLANYFECRMMRKALGRVWDVTPFGSVLDIPAGAGRMLPVIASFGASAFAMDTSAAMLAEGRRFEKRFKTPPVFIAASAFEIPLIDDAVDVAMCVRLLHHFEQSDHRVAILKELTRVARTGVVISFFDSASFQAWRSCRKSRRPGRTQKRFAVSRRQCIDEARSAGLKLLGMDAQLRYHSQITAAAFVPSGPVA